MLIASNKIGTTGGRGRLCGAGYNAEIAAVSAAVQNAVPAVVPFVPLGLFAPLVAAQVPVPKLALPLVKVTVPVGPAPLLGVVTNAVSVTVAPEVIVPRLLATVVVVDAFATVTDSVLLVLVW
jgi:hypothetical protein